MNTPHERDPLTTLDYRGARYYDSDIARFLSVDPLAAQFPEWSAYNYVFGNPIIWIDPSGAEPTGWNENHERLLETFGDPYGLSEVAYGHGQGEKEKKKESGNSSSSGEEDGQKPTGTTNYISDIVSLITDGIVNTIFGEETDHKGNEKLVAPNVMPYASVSLGKETGEGGSPVSLFTTLTWTPEALYTTYGLDVTAGTPSLFRLPFSVSIGAGIFVGNENVKARDVIKGYGFSNNFGTILGGTVGYSSIYSKPNQYGITLGTTPFYLGTSHGITYKGSNLK